MGSRRVRLRRRGGSAGGSEPGARERKRERELGTKDHPLKLLHRPARGVLLRTKRSLENGWRLSWGSGERTAHV